MRAIASWIIVILCTGFFTACSSSGSKSSGALAAEKRLLGTEVQDSIALAKSRDRGIHRFFDVSAGYAVFPTISKGGLIIGGAHGEGQLFEKGKLIGATELSQGTFGLQAGGQTYSEFIFFKDVIALNKFKRGEFEFSGQASAVAVDAGASADIDYESGVLVFTMAKSGLMLEASIGGQQFDYWAY
ncbi:MAG: lipid-binding SYLF domain-containing protein [Planctomycetota bacterium]